MGVDFTPSGLLMSSGSEMVSAMQVRVRPLTDADDTVELRLCVAAEVASILNLSVMNSNLVHEIGRDVLRRKFGWGEEKRDIVAHSTLLSDLYPLCECRSGKGKMFIDRASMLEFWRLTRCDVKVIERGGVTWYLPDWCMRTSSNGIDITMKSSHKAHYFMAEYAHSTCLERALPD